MDVSATLENINQHSDYDQNGFNDGELEIKTELVYLEEYDEETDVEEECPVKLENQIKTECVVKIENVFIDTPEGSKSIHDLVVKSSDGFDCGVCGESYDRADPCRKHVTKTHPLKLQPNNGRHPNYSKESVAKSKYKKYIKFDDPVLRCKLCDSSYKDISSMRRHVLTHLNEPKPMDEQIRAALKVSKYKEYIDYENEILRCNLCQKQFGEMNSMRRHIKDHLDSDGLVKDLHITAQNEKEKLHQTVLKSKYKEYIDYEDGILKCNLCQKEFKEMISLRRHIKDHLEADVANEDPETAAQIEKEKRHQTVLKSKYKEYIHYEDGILKCNLCEKEFKEMISLRRHIKDHLDADVVNEDPETAAQNEKEKLHQAWMKTKYKEYINYNDGEITCAMCERPYPEMDAMRRHIQLHLQSPDPLSYRTRTAPLTGTKKRAPNIRKHGESNEYIIEEGEDSFRCKVCERTYTKRDSIRRHVIDIHISQSGRPRNTERKKQYPEVVDYIIEEGDSFKCKVCDLVCKVKSSMTRHIILKHLEEGQERIQCAHCESRIKSCHYERHLQKFHSVARKCPICQEEVIGNYRGHMRLHGVQKNPSLEDGNTDFLCDLCGSVFLNKQRLEYHRKKHFMPEVEIVRCPVCNRRMSQDKMAEHLKNHEATQLGQNKCICEICGKEFNSEGGLIYHRRHKHRENPNRFTCEICQSTFVTGTTLREHMNIHTGAKPHECDKCGTRFSHPNTCRRHKRKCNGEAPTRSFPKRRAEILNCRFCDKTFSGKSRTTLLKSHEATHNGTVCETCRVGFLERAAYESHQCVPAADGQEYTCDVCDKTMKMRRNLTTHLNSHKGPKPEVCSVCSKRYSTPKQLNHHMKIHTGEKFECSFCGKDFADRYGLRLHEALHTGEARHSCETCGAGFYRLQNLQRHKCERTYKCRATNSIPRPKKRKVHTEDSDTESDNPSDLLSEIQTATDSTDTDMHIIRHQEQPQHHLQQPHPMHLSQPQAPYIPSAYDQQVHALALYHAMSMNDVMNYQPPYQPPDDVQLPLYHQNQPVVVQQMPQQFWNPGIEFHQQQQQHGECQGHQTDTRKVEKLVIKLPKTTTSKQQQQSNLTWMTASPSTSMTSSSHDVTTMTPPVDVNAFASNFCGDEDDDMDDNRDNMDYVEESSDADDITEYGTKPKVVTKKHRPRFYVSNDKDSDSDAEVKKAAEYASVSYKKTSRNFTTPTVVMCLVCKEVFTSAQDLRDHSSVHTDGNVQALLQKSLKETNETHICIVCDKRFTNAELLRLHNLRKHLTSSDDDKNCKICGKFFMTKLAMAGHMRLHAEDCPFKCTLCHSKFKTAPELSKHIKTHTGEKPCSCDICGMCFGANAMLNMHKKFKHPGDNTKDVMKELTKEKKKAAESDGRSSGKE